MAKLVALILTVQLPESTMLALAERLRDGRLPGADGILFPCCSACLGLYSNQKTKERFLSSFLGYALEDLVLCFSFNKDELNKLYTLPPWPHRGIPESG